MRRFRYNDQSGLEELTEEDILSTYYSWWSYQMFKVGKLLMVSEERCIEDWLVVHWGWEVKDS